MPLALIQMSTSLDHLLPAADDSVRCAEHARTIAVDPGGTAIRADRVVVVTTPLPWPKPALNHPLLEAMATELRQASVPTRLLAAVPYKDGESGRVVMYDRQGPAAVERRYRFGHDPERLAAFGRALALDDQEQLADFDPSSAEPARPAVLICTQGSHDVCCGSEGTRLADQLEALVGSSGGPALPDGASLPEGVEVFRVSHTGGHRFAPTALTLPDGRMWAGLDASMIALILNASGDPASLVGHCRGWWGADTGPAQMAERAVFAELGWSLNGADRTVDVRAGDGAESEVCTVTTDDGSWQIEVAVGREVPTIACRQPGGQPAKPGREYAVISVEDTAGRL